MPPLPDELLEEVFLRLPPDEPECLVRASLASKLWLGLLTGARFRGRYRELHGARPATMLGFFYIWPKHRGPEGKEPAPYPHFVSATKFAARIPDDTEWRDRDYAAWDCRHGRVLFGERDRGPGQLIVWDPITADWTGLKESRDYTEASSRAAADITRRRVETCFGLNLPFHAPIEPMPPVLDGDALHFMLAHDNDVHPVGVLKYDVGSDRLSLIDAPCSWSITADGGWQLGMKLKTLRWRKLWKSENFRALFPYMSFYGPEELAEFAKMEDEAIEAEVTEDEDEAIGDEVTEDED
ncbi:hypothetical protein VPH35_018691 [Triticum aestivum]